MEFLKTKTILTKVKYGKSWYGIDYNMNLYKGCSHRCIYCDSRSKCYHIDNFEVVRGKENEIQILEKELSRKKETGVIGIGSMSDTYNPLEKEYKITRQALQLISKYNFGVSIDTKSDLILRDIDILKEINKKNNVIVKVTITTPRDELSKIIEPCVATSSRRFEVIKELTSNNIFAGIMMNPTLPYITDSEEDIKEMVRLAASSGAKFIHTYFSVTLRDIQRDYFYQKLDENFPGLKEKYQKKYKDNYYCCPQNYERLNKVFIEECKKYNILYKMEDIIKAYKKEIKTSKQISLF